MDNNATLVHASCYFQDEPRKWAKELAGVAKVEGYEYIQPTVEMLEECHPDNREVMGLLTMLRQREWEWRDCTNDPSIRFFGISRDGKFVARGYYVVGRHETGEVHVLRDFGQTANYVVGKSSLRDPREEYEARAVRAKVWHRKKKYFVVMVGRVVDLVKYGFAKQDVKETGGKGYFGRFPAFAVLDGPYDKEEAKSIKSSL